MKHLLKAAFTLMAVVLCTAAFAQSTGAYLKYDLNGKTISHKNAELNAYNKFEPETEDEKAGNDHVLYVSYEVKVPYKLDIIIHTPPHAAPAVGKLPYVQTVVPKDGPCPSVHFSMTKTVGEEFEFFGSEDATVGNFEITKVAAGWVEGKFDIELPRQYATNGEVLHITNGTFRFKIDKEMKD